MLWLAIRVVADAVVGVVIIIRVVVRAAAQGVIPPRLATTAVRVRTPTEYFVV
jgi:hypothetical protein